MNSDCGYKFWIFGWIDLGVSVLPIHMLLDDFFDQIFSEFAAWYYWRVLLSWAVDSGSCCGGIGGWSACGGMLFAHFFVSFCLEVVVCRSFQCCWGFSESLWIEIGLLFALTSGGFWGNDWGLKFSLRCRVFNINILLSVECWLYRSTTFSLYLLASEQYLDSYYI